MIKYVYELYNLMGTVEYVGETTNPKKRFSNHKCKGKASGQGKFHNRLDISMNVCAEFDNKKDAYDHQCDLQNEYGLQDEREVKKMNGRIKPSSEAKLKMSISAKQRGVTPPSQLGKKRIK